MNRLRLIPLLLVSLIFSACQTPPSPGVSTSTPGAIATKTPGATNTPVVESRLGVQAEALNGLTVDVWHAWYGVPSSLFESQVEEFNSTNPWGILVQAKSFQNYTELYEQASAAVNGPDRPDVVVGLPEYAVEWNAQEAVLDLTPYVSDPLYGLSNAEIADFPSVFLKQDQFGDVRLAMPAQRTARLLLYNQSWANELGFEAPPATSTEFQEQACKANQAMHSDADPQNDGQGGWLIDTQPMTGLAWLLAFGGGAQEENNFRFLTPENIQATRFIKGLEEDGCAWKTQNITPLSKFVDRSALFATASLEDLPDLARAFASAGSTDKWTVLPFPGPAGSALVVYGSSYILFNSDDPDQLAAWLFVRWLLSPENQADWVNSVGYFPLQASTMSLLADYAAGHPQWAEAVESAATGTHHPATGDLAHRPRGAGRRFHLHVPGGYAGRPSARHPGATGCACDGFE